MREIKFKAKRLDNGEWAEGYYVKTPTNQHRIYWQPFKEATSNTYHEVDAETVCQYTGIDDRFGAGVFENDIVEAVDFYHQKSNRKKPIKCVVQFSSGGFHLSAINEIRFGISFDGCKVLGNIHDLSPEL